MNTIPDISILSNYMFSQENIIELRKCKDIESKNIESKKIESNGKRVKPIENKQVCDYFLPTHKDSLFWCFFIITKGQFTYESLHSSNFCEEMGEKIQIVENIGNHTDILKNNKWKKSIIEHNLISEKKISLQTFFYICSTRDINVVIIKGRSIYILENNKDNSYELLLYSDNGYMLSQHTPVDKLALISEYKVKYFNIENINKPLRAISSYKIAELRDISDRLDISHVSNDGKKYNKKQLYEIIREHI